MLLKVELEWKWDFCVCAFISNQLTFGAGSLDCPEGLMGELCIVTWHRMLGPSNTIICREGTLWLCHDTWHVRGLVEYSLRMDEGSLWPTQHVWSFMEYRMRLNEGSLWPCHNTSGVSRSIGCVWMRTFYSHYLLCWTPWFWRYDIMVWSTLMHWGIVMICIAVVKMNYLMKNTISSNLGAKTT